MHDPFADSFILSSFYFFYLFLYKQARLNASHNMYVPTFHPNAGIPSASRHTFPLLEVACKSLASPTLSLKNINLFVSYSTAQMKMHISMISSRRVRSICTASFLLGRFSLIMALEYICYFFFCFFFLFVSFITFDEILFIRNLIFKSRIL
jgi:hypothetical protein